MVPKAEHVPIALGLIEEELPRLPSKDWTEMIRRICEVDRLLCPQYGGSIKVIAFLTYHAVVDHIIDHLKLTFVPERPSPP